MTRFVGAQLPSDLQARFSAEQMSMHAHNVIQIITVDEDGFPHPAMLSHFEIVCRDAQTMRIATYSDSQTTANMRRTGQLTIIVVDSGMAYYIKGRVDEIRSQMRTAPHNTLLNFRVESVSADHSDVEREGESSIVTGITYIAPNLAGRLSAADATFAEMLE